MNRATQHGENSRTVFAAQTLHQKTRRTLPAAASPKPTINASHPPASPRSEVSLPPCFPASLPPPFRANRNRKSNRNTVANRNRRNLLKTKPRQISNRNKNRYVAFTDLPPRFANCAFLLGTRMQAESGVSHRKQTIGPHSTRYAKRGLPWRFTGHESRVTSHESQVTAHRSPITTHHSPITLFLRHPMLYWSLLRNAGAAAQDFAASKFGQGVAVIPGRRKG